MIVDGDAVCKKNIIVMFEMLLNVLLMLFTVGEPTSWCADPTAGVAESSDDNGGDEGEVDVKRIKLDMDAAAAAAGAGGAGDVTDAAGYGPAYTAVMQQHVGEQCLSAAAKHEPELYASASQSQCRQDMLWLCFVCVIFCSFRLAIPLSYTLM